MSNKDIEEEMESINREIDFLINNIKDLPEITATTMIITKKPLLLKIQNILLIAERYKNMYEAEHRIHLVRNEQLAKKEIAVLKANKYDNLIKMLEEILNNKYIMVFDGRVEYVDNEMIMKDTKYIKATALQDLLETIEGEKKKC